MANQLNYYNYDKLYSFNCPYNFLIGGRGLGKTYGAKKKAIVAAIKNGDMFIYLRRYETEMKAAAPTFFVDIVHEFPAMDFRRNGNLAQMAPIETRSVRKREWQDIGYFIALSTAQKLKSIAFPKVKLIIFDEFIIEKGATHYIADEAKVFNNFYSTVDRYKDKTKVLFLANSVSIMNPYFIEYGIEPDKMGELTRMYDGFILVHMPNSDEFNNQVYQTKFGKFIKGTEYADYAVGNQFVDNGQALIDEKGYKAKYQFTLECRSGTFSIWYEMVNDRYYAQAKLPKAQEIFTLIPERMSEDKTLMTFTDRPLQYLRTAFRSGRVMFDKPGTRNAFIEIFKR